MVVTEVSKIWLIRAALLIGGAALLAVPWKPLIESAPPPQKNAPETNRREIPSEAISGLLRGIGEAAFVALFLELLVDTPLKKRLVRETIHETTPEIASRILSRLLPTKLFTQIEEDVLRAKLVRRAWNITYTIRM